MQVTFTDQGPGIADVELAMTDGHADARGLGIGIERLEATRQRICDRIGAWQRHDGAHCEVEVIGEATDRQVCVP